MVPLNNLDQHIQVTLTSKESHAKTEMKVLALRVQVFTPPHHEKSGDKLLDFYCITWSLKHNKGVSLV